MVQKTKQKINDLEDLSLKITNWIGTPYSIIFHTILFIGIFILSLFGVDIDSILLILTTAVSLEAIYLAIFIQMTVNRHAESLESVEDEIEDISEDVEDITEDMEAEDLEDKKTQAALDSIMTQLQKIQKDLDLLKKHQ